MKRIVTIFIFSLPYTMACVGQESIEQRIEKLLDGDLFATSQVGLMVYDLTADSVVFVHGERQLLRPASTMKLLTAITALDCLGPSYRLRTSLAYTGTISGSTLTGNLYCIGGFDPLFDDTDMRAFVKSVVNLGIDTIRGGVIEDKSMKGSELLGEGWCWDDDNPSLSPLTINRKDIFADRLIRRLFEAGVYVDATIRQGITPNDADTLCNRYHSIEQVLTRMMKHSDNLFAEALFYQIAASSGYKYVKATDAKAKIRQLMTKIGISEREYRVADGSGLSQYNYLTPAIEVKLLRYAFRSNRIYMHLYPTLPIAGVDGTLRHRMKGTRAAANVHAKTGTLTGLSSLAGYCIGSNGNVLCFSIINQGCLNSASARAFQDRVCTIICE